MKKIVKKLSKSFKKLFLRASGIAQFGEHKNMCKVLGLIFTPKMYIS